MSHASVQSKIDQNDGLSASLPIIDIYSVSSTSLSVSSTSRSSDISITSSSLENTDYPLPLILENGSDLNSRSRDCTDDMFDAMLTKEALLSSDVSNVSVTDTPVSILARNQRIVNSRSFDPLSEASSDSLYSFIEQSCKNLCHSWIGELHIPNIQENEQSHPIDMISSAGFHDKVSKQSLSPTIFCSKIIPIENVFNGAGFSLLSSTLINAAMHSCGYYLIRNGFSHYKKGNGKGVIFSCCRCLAYRGDKKARMTAS